MWRRSLARLCLAACAQRRTTRCGCARRGDVDCAWPPGTTHNTTYNKAWPPGKAYNTVWPPGKTYNTVWRASACQGGPALPEAGGVPHDCAAARKSRDKALSLWLHAAGDAPTGAAGGRAL
eukprot:144136-Chlamydomonas_euryale.AAC.2